METKKVSPLDFIKDNRELLIPYIGLVLCLVIFSIVPPITTGRTIYTPMFLSSFIERSMTLLILSLGAIFIYSMGSMDISVGATAGVASIILVSISNKTGNFMLGMVAGMVFTVACGAVNATVGEALKLPSVIGSVFLMFFGGGIQALVFKNTSSITFDGNYTFFDQMGVKIVIVAVYFIITYYLFKFTKLGKYTRAIGTNNIVARQSGVHVWLYKFIAYSYLGIAVVFASFNSLVRTHVVTKETGGDYHMQIMIALILGGMPLSGGMKSRVTAAIIGTFIYNILDTGLVLSGVPLAFVQFVKSLILFTIIVITCRRKTTLLQR